MGSSMGGLTIMQKALSMILVIVVVYGCYAVTTNDEVMKSINRVMASIQNKPEPEDAPAPAPQTKPAAGTKTSAAVKK